ncbi:MAG: metalloregulator ArsR/SmtB family transcription factor [Coriobacteriia bacterium]|nr:metalloregulator ArsR/SmtB family transcription factor [Coriobacteriia bacterium]
MSTRSYKPHRSCGSVASGPQPIVHGEEELPDAAHFESTARIFDTLSDPTRLRILWVLSVGDQCVCDLAAAIGVTQSAASHQLRLLRDRGLVTSKRDGKHVVYRLADAHVESLLAQGLAHAGERR